MNTVLFVLNVIQIVEVASGNNLMYVLLVIPTNTYTTEDVLRFVVVAVILPELFVLNALKDVLNAQIQEYVMIV
jgi:hypothetical protein